MSKVTKKHLDHLHLLVDEFHKLMEPKYIKGVKEHGGGIWDMSDEELELEETMEIIDLAVYRLTRILKKLQASR